MTKPRNFLRDKNGEEEEFTPRNFVADNVIKSPFLKPYEKEPAHRYFSRRGVYIKFNVEFFVWEEI